jgi:hypothetical protein
VKQTPEASKSALAGFETTIGLIDDVDAALTAHQPVVAVSATQGFQGITDFHDNLWLLFRRYIRSPPSHVNASCPPVVTGIGLL